MTLRKVGDRLAAAYSRQIMLLHHSFYPRCFQHRRCAVVTGAARDLRVEISRSSDP
jgi:hypothetical protein